MEFLHDQRGQPHSRNVPDVLLHKAFGSTEDHHPSFKTELRDVPDAYFWLHLWSVVSIQTLQLHTAAAIPFIAVCTFVCCALTSELISRLPGSKWIIGA